MGAGRGIGLDWDFAVTYDPKDKLKMEDRRTRVQKERDARLQSIVRFVNVHSGCNQATQIMEDDNDSLMLYCGECHGKEQQYRQDTGYALRVDVIPEYASMLADRGHSNSEGIRTRGSER